MGEKTIPDHDADKQGFFIGEPINPSTIYPITLSESVVHKNSHYYVLLDFLQKVNEDEEVLIRLGNTGGSLMQCVMLCNAIRQCKGTTHIEVIGPCYSAGAIIATCGDKLTMNPGTFLMYHNYSTCEWGKAKEVTMTMEAHNDMYSHILLEFCSPFLTKSEIKQLLNDNDVYVKEWDTEDVNKRMKRHFK